MEKTKICLSVAETARALGLSRPKVYELINRSDFPAFRCGGRTLVSVEGLHEWVRQQIPDQSPAERSA